jgi:hypothetical protein
MRSWSTISDDGGGHWRIAAQSPSVGAAEPMVVELASGELLMNARSVQWPHDGKPHPDRFRLYSTSTGECRAPCVDACRA